MARLLLPIALLSLLSIGAIFGFFYAWVCSTLWGLDAIDPRIAIPAMQAMNASVRNPVFFPAFFLTPVFLLTTSALAWRLRRNPAAALFAASGLLYVVGAFLVTVLVNVPMNEALAQTAVPADRLSAARIWQDYSGAWQFWNTGRALVSGVALGLAGLGMLSIQRPAPGTRRPCTEAPRRDGVAGSPER